MINWFIIEHLLESTPSCICILKQSVGTFDWVCMHFGMWKQSWADLSLMIVISWWLASDDGLLRHCVSSSQWCNGQCVHPRSCHGDVLCVCIALSETVRWYELFRWQHSGPSAFEGEKSINWLWNGIACGWSWGLFYTRWENHCMDKLWSNVQIDTHCPFYYEHLCSSTLMLYTIMQQQCSSNSFR